MTSSESAGNLHPEMAETIAANVAAFAEQMDAAAGACASAAAAAATTAVQFDDEEYPFAQGFHNGVKCCTKCGATKTPQWREGPFGSKTLCNACGVKRTRKLRAEQEGAKRRKLSASPAPPAQLKGHTYSPTAPLTKYGSRGYTQELPPLAHGIDSYGSLEPDYEAWGLPSHPPAGGGGSGRRPPRRAAEEAAFKTARYARTGEWAEGQEGAVFEDAVRAATPSSSDYSLPSSSCPEEVSWPPHADTAGATGSDCYAAINLMTMSAKQTAHALSAAVAASGATATAAATSSGGSPASGSGAGSGAGAPFVAAPIDAAAGGSGGAGAKVGPGLDPEQISHDGLLALAAKYEGVGAHVPHPHKVAPVDLHELSQCLPPAKVLELVRLNQELELAVHEAHAANAAVAAVAQVLAAKQAAALRSREVAGSATKRLRRFMAELDTQFGIQSKFGTSGSSWRRQLKPTSAGLSSPVLSPAAPVPAPQLPVAPALNARTL